VRSYLSMGLAKSDSEHGHHLAVNSSAHSASDGNDSPSSDRAAVFGISKMASSASSPPGFRSPSADTQDEITL
jgi:hypothetical protein